MVSPLVTALLAALIVMLIVVAVLAWQLVRRKRAEEERAAELQQEREQERATVARTIAEREEAHTTAITQREQAHTAAISVITADGQQRLATADQAAATAEERRKAAEDAAAELRRHLADGVKWDRVSRDDIVRAFSPTTSGGKAASGFVATNVVFCPVDEGVDTGFSAQIDHVIVSSDGILIVENKHWSGVVFNSIHPRTVHSALGSLFTMTQDDEKVRDLTAPFSIHATTPNLINAVTFTVHDGAKSPTKQVQRQALRLNALLKKNTRVGNWIDTMVYYSHRGATVHSETKDEKTIIVRSERELPAAISAWRNTPRPPLTDDEITRIADHFRDLGADLQGIGRDTTTWKSVISPRR